MSLRTAIIGIGGIAHKGYLPILAAWEGIELVLCSRNTTVLKSTQAQYRIAHSTTSLDVLCDWRPDVAFVLTPADTHRTIVEKLLRAGIDVFVEKPATQSSLETHQLAEIADELGRVLMVAFNRRYAPLHRQAKELWGNQPIQLALFEKHRSSASHPNLYQNFIEDTVHIIDLLRFFCGEVEVISTVEQAQNGLLVGAASTTRLSEGGFGIVLTSLQAGGWREHYTLHGSSSSLYIDAFNRLVFIDRDGEHTWQETYASTWQTTLKARGFFDQIAHFLDCVQTRQVPQTSAWDALKTQLLLEAIVACAT